MTATKYAPAERRDLLMSMIYGLAEGLSPQDGSWLTTETQNKIADIQRALEATLGLPASE